MLAAILGASIFRSMLAGKGAVTTSEGVLRADKGTSRSGHDS